MEPTQTLDGQKDSAHALKKSPSSHVLKAKSQRGLTLVLVAIFISGLVIWLDSVSRYALIEVTLNAGLDNRLPELNATSVSGYDSGMRRLILPALGADGYQWVMHTQKMVSEGAWRIRHTDTDNAPQGREIHWSHAFIWWLVVTGKVHSLITGWPLPASIEAVTPFANTLFLMPILIVLPLVAYRAFGWMSGVLMALGYSCIYLLYELFVVGAADHHGLAVLGGSCSSLFLLIGGAGWVTHGRQDALTFGVVFSERARAKRWFIASGLAAAFGLWISAATLVPVLAGIGIGALVGGFLFRKNRESDSAVYDPSLWRIWGLAGATGSLGFYFLEYFPSEMGMRLEVNHPLYALAFFCGGDLISRLLSLGQTPNTPGQRAFRLVPFLLSCAGLCLLPVLILLAPERFFHVSDPFLWALHKDYIHEFRTILGRLDGMQMEGAIVIMSTIPLTALIILRLFWMKDLPKPWKGLLCLALGPATVLLVLGILQVRWLGISNGLWLVALVATFGAISAISSSHRFSLFEKAAAGLILASIFLPHPWVVATFLVESHGKKPTVGAGSAFTILVRDAAQTLRRMNGDKPLRVLSGPTTSTWLSYFGGMQSVGTLYWENIEGLKAAANMYSAKNEREALEMLKARGITHIVIFSVDEFSAPYIRLARGLPHGSQPKDAFADSVLYGSSFPHWVTPIHFAMPPEFKNEWVAILEVKPEQTPAEARLGIGRFFASRGDMRAARREFEEAVKLDPNLSDAHLELAGFLFLAGEIMPARIHFGEGIKGKTEEQIAEACFTIASYCQDLGLHAQAVELLKRGVKAAPDAASIKNLLAWILATSRDDSVRNPQEALDIAISNFGFIGQSAYVNTLAAAQAACGQYDKALVSIRAAIVVAEEAGEPKHVINEYRKKEIIYSSQMPYTE